MRYGFAKPIMRDSYQRSLSNLWFKEIDDDVFCHELERSTPNDQIQLLTLEAAVYCADSGLKITVDIPLNECDLDIVIRIVR